MFTIFAAFKTKNIFLMSACVVFFIATNTALHAAKKGYQIPAVCCTSDVSECSWSRMGGDSLSCLLNFSYAMTKSNENASKVNNSSRTSTPDCESVAHSEKQFNFSKFNNYFNQSVPPDELTKGLQEIRAFYLELSLHALMEQVGMKPVSISPHADVLNHINYLSELIDLVENLK